MSWAQGFRAWRAVFLRELMTYRLLPLAGLLMGLMATLAGFLPPSVAREPLLMRDILALISALTLSICALGILGSHALIRDYVQGRLSFYLSRPISAACLWLGKVTAILTLVAGAGFLALLPTLLLGGRPFTGTGAGELLDTVLLRLAPTHGGGSSSAFFWNEHGPWLLPLVLLTVLALGHLSAVVFGLRSPWTIADLVVVMAMGLIAGAAYRLGVELGADRAVLHLMTGVAVALTAAAGVGGWALLYWGRGDGNRAHRVQSLILWAALIVTVIPLSWRILSIQNLPPSSLDLVTSSRVVAEGPWISLFGRHQSTGYQPHVLWNTDDHRWLRLPRVAGLYGRTPHPAFSGNGRKMLIHNCRQANSSCVVSVYDLDSLNGRDLDPGAGFSVQVNHPVREPILTYDGEHLLIPAADDKSMQLYRLATGRLVAEFPAPRNQNFYWTWSGPENKLVVAGLLFGDSPPARQLLLHEADLSSPEPRLEYLDTLAGNGRPLYRDYILHGSWGNDERSSWQAEGLYDLRRLRAIDLPEVPSLIHVKRLSGQRWLLVSLDTESAIPNRAVWRLWQESGELSAPMKVPRYSAIAGEAAADLVMVGEVAPQEKRRFYDVLPFLLRRKSEHWRTAWVDLKSGEPVHQIEGYWPLGCLPPGPCRRPDTGNLVEDGLGKIYRVDLKTWEIQPLMVEPR